VRWYRGQKTYPKSYQKKQHYSGYSERRRCFSIMPLDPPFFIVHNIPPFFLAPVGVAGRGWKKDIQFICFQGVLFVRRGFYALCAVRSQGKSASCENGSVNF